MELYLNRNITRHRGHLFRRFIHISIGFFPFIYYWFNTTIAAYLPISLSALLISIIFLTIFFESVRLLSSIIIFGQREYEAKTISSIAWTIVCVVLILLFVPQIGFYGAGLGLPLIVSLALADPAMGEARILGFSKSIVFLTGIMVTLIIWLVSARLLGTPAKLIPFIVPLTVLSEMINIKWIDDNARMLLIPFLFILVLSYSNFI